MKRSLAILMVIVFAFSMLTACGNSGSSENTAASVNSSTQAIADNAGSKSGEQIKIRFINGFTGGDGAFMKKMVDSFNSSQSKYFIDQLITADHYTKFKTDNFDMLIIHADLISTFHEDGLLREVSDIYKSANLSPEKDFHPIAQTYVKYDDGIFAFPLDLYADTMYYNKELVDKVPATYADLLELKNKLNSEKTGIYPIAIPLSGDHDWLTMAMLTQMKVNFVENGHLKLDTDEAAEALLKINRMIYKDKLSAPKMAANDDINAFLKKSEEKTNIQAALSLTGPWNYTSAKETWGDKLGIAAFPTLGETLRVPAGGHTFAVSAKCDDPDKLAGIAAFMSYIYKPDVMLTWADSGQAPIHLATMEVVKGKPDLYPVAAVNYEIFDKAEILPPVYNIREQVKYLYNNVWELIYSKPDLTKEELMVELKNATKTAEELAEH